MKVGFVTADWSDMEDPDTGYPTLGGSGWYRCGLPSRELRRNGIETVVVELVSISDDGLWLHDWDKSVHKDCDVVVFQRWMDEAGPEVIRRARRAGQIVVNDLDDWYWGLDHRNEAFKASDPKLHPTSNRAHYWDSICASDLVTVSTPFLADKLKGIAPEVSVVRNAIDLDRWSQNKVVADPPVVGWVGSTRHRSGDLETLIGILGPFCKTNDLMFAHAGYWGDDTPTAGDLAKVDRNNQLVYGLQSIIDYPKLFSVMDIGIVPLNQIPFNFAKSCIKGMEYAASGVPFIAERTPEYDWLKKTHDIGITCRKPREWAKSLDRLLDVGFRLEEQQRNLENVKQLDIGLRWGDWESAYQSAIR